MKAKAVQKRTQSQKREAGDSKHIARTILISSIVIVIIAAVAGFAIYRERVAPFRLSVLVVDGSEINMRYFLKRVNMSGQDPFAMLQALLREELIKQVAPKPPYNITVSEQEIDQFFRETARGTSEEISDEDFEEWYRQQINESRLSKSEFRDVGRTNVLALRLQEYLAAKVPTVAEQVLLNMILVNDMEAARQAKARADAGEGFARLAGELSIDERMRENGGEFGWVPRGALVPVLARTAFDELEIGKVSEPIYLDDQTFAVVMVSERAPAMEIAEDYLRGLQAGALEDWLITEEQYHEMEFHGFTNGYDTETDAWVRWQLQRMKR